MSRHPANARKGIRAKATLMAGVAGVALVAASVMAPANATVTSPSVRGATTITLGGKAINTLQSNGCGPLTATVLGDAAAVSTPKGVKLILKVSGLDIQDGSGAIRLKHSGGVTLENSCYTISLTGFRITNFGTVNETSDFDLNALVKGSGVREVVGTLDMSSAQITFTGSTVRVNQMNLLASDDGAKILNQLALGTDTGPFTSGDKVGFAKTKVTFFGM